MRLCCSISGQNPHASWNPEAWLEAKPASQPALPPGRNGSSFPKREQTGNSGGSERKGKRAKGQEKEQGHPARRRKTRVRCLSQFIRLVYRMHSMRQNRQTQKHPTCLRAQVTTSETNLEPSRNTSVPHAPSPRASPGQPRGCCARKNMSVALSPVRPQLYSKTLP